MAEKEKVIENRIKNYLDHIGAYYFKVHGSQFQAAGTPDILSCYDGQFIAIEVKRPDDGVVSELQKHKMKQIQKAGGIAFVATSVPEVKAELQRLNVI